MTRRRRFPRKARLPVYWDRFQATVTHAGGAAPTDPEGQVIFDPRFYLQSSVLEGTATLMNIRLNLATYIQVADATGVDTGNVLIYMGVYGADRDIPTANPNMLGANDPQVDWLDLWYDAISLGSGDFGLTSAFPSANTLRQGPLAGSRNIRVRRRLQSNQVVVLTTFPVFIGGAPPTSWNINTYVVNSNLGRESLPR